MHKSVTDFPLLSLELTQVRVYSFVFFPTLSVVLCVSVKKCIIPLVGDEKTARWITGHEWFKKAEIVGSAGGVLAQGA